ncbi:MAG: Ig-like domain-containing protein [Roseburia sp.]|nr:Ig-like domain-containing protein [Roseburia sp.]
MKRKLLLALAVMVCVLCCALCLTACNGGSDTVAVESVTLSQTTLTLEIDGTETLTATVTPDNATDKTVTWSSSAPTIATVDNAGKVTAKAEGTATITATTANDKTATCAVTVNAPAPVAMTQAQWTAALSASAFDDFTVVFYSQGHRAETEATSAFVDGKLYILEDGDTWYYSIESNKYYEYFKDEASEKFTKTEVTKADYDENVDNVIVIFTSLAADMSKFTFDDTDNSYFGEDLEIEGMSCDVTLKFENGKLTYFAAEISDSDMTMVYELVHGETDVTLPTNIIVSNS